MSEPAPAARSQPEREAGATPTGDWTVERLLTWTREYFGRQELESPRLWAEILLAPALGRNHLRMFPGYGPVPAAPLLDRFRAMVREAAAGKPISYLTGTKDFFSLTFEVTPDVLVPRPETEVLVERAIDLVRKRLMPGRDPAAPPLEILDLCTGSGCIAVALARHLGAARLLASDSSEPALGVARRNAARHGLSERIEFRRGDLFECWEGQAFDVIVSNPPYVGADEPASLPITVRDFEPHVALFAGPDGLAILRRSAEQAAGFLRPGGRLLLEVGYRQAEAVRQLLEDCGWDDIVTFRDHSQHERVIQAGRA